MQGCRLVLPRALMNQHARATAHHDHVVMKGAGIDRIGQLAHKDAALKFQVSKTQDGFLRRACLACGEAGRPVFLATIILATVHKNMADTSTCALKTRMIGRAFIGKGRRCRQGIMHGYRASEHRAQLATALLCFERTMRGGDEIGRNQMTAAIAAVNAGNHRARIGRPHEGRAAGDTEDARFLRGCRQHIGIITDETGAPQKTELRSRQRRQQQHWHPISNQPSDLIETLQRPGTRVGRFTTVSHAREVAMTETTEVMGRPGDALNLHFT